MRVYVSGKQVADLVDAEDGVIVRAGLPFSRQHAAQINDRVERELSMIRSKAAALFDDVETMRDTHAQSVIPPLWGAKEIADHHGLSRAALSWWRRHADFPEPVQTLACGSLWRVSDVVAWVAARRVRHEAREA